MKGGGACALLAGSVDEQRCRWGRWPRSWDGEVDSGGVEAVRAIRRESATGPRTGGLVLGWPAVTLLGRERTACESVSVRVVRTMTEMVGTTVDWWFGRWHVNEWLL